MPLLPSDLVPIDQLGFNVHLATLHRWRAQGVLTPTGRRVRLKATRVGGRYFCRPSDAAQFVRELNCEQTDGGAE